MLNNTIGVSWQIFKDFVNSRKTLIQYIEVEDCYYLITANSYFKISCVLQKSNEDVVDFESNFKAISNIEIKTEVVTSFEKDDKVLKLSKLSGSFNNNICEAVIKIPSGGRWIGGGSAFTNSFYCGDVINSIDIIDIDNIFGYGNNVVVSSYCDNFENSEYNGWFFEPYNNNTGYIDIEPLGGYAYVPEGLYLKIKCTKMPLSQATEVYFNVWWAK